MSQRRIKGVANFRNGQAVTTQYRSRGVSRDMPLLRGNGRAATLPGLTRCG